jgi:hypothetical protein
LRWPRNLPHRQLNLQKTLHRRLPPKRLLNLL